jgi:hypothetical protein
MATTEAYSARRHRAIEIPQVEYLTFRGNSISVPTTTKYGNLIHSLAQSRPNKTVGCSKIVCDSGDKK